MAEIQFNVDAALAKLEALVSTHGPQAIDMAAQVVRINALNELSCVPVAGVLALAAGYGMRWCYRRAKAATDTYDDDFGWWIGFCIAGILALFTLALCLDALCDVWAWVALFNPKLALAHEIMQRLGGH